MKNLILKVSLASIMLLLLFFTLIPLSFSQEKKVYVCFPCGNECDLVIHNEEGTCSVCNMPIIEKSRVKFENLTPEEVADIVSHKNDVIILDVRTEKEYIGEAGDSPEKKAGHIKNAINIPHNKLENRIAELEEHKDREIIVYCSHSHRSPYSAQILTDNGFTNVKNMAEGLSYWVEKGLKNTTTGETLLEK